MTTLQRIVAALAAALLLAAPLWAVEPDSELKFENDIQFREMDANLVVRKDGTSPSAAMRPVESLAIAASQQLAAMEVLDKLITTDSREKSQMDERWQMACGKFFNNARGRYDDAERAMAERHENLSTTQPFRDEMRKFMDDIEGNGHACMVWRRLTFAQKEDLKNATENYPNLTDSTHREMKDAHDVLLAGEALLTRTGLTVRQVEDQLEKIRVAGRVAQACGNMAKERCSRIKEEFGDKAPELDRKVQQTLTDWKAIAQRYPNLSSTLSPYPPKWAGKMKEQWDAFLRVRKDFDTTYAPLLGGKLFDDLTLFKGVAYGELYKPLDAVKTKLIAKREAIKRRTADEAAIQKALEEERRLSVEERKKWDAYNGMWGAQAQRDLELRVANINSATREREIRLIEARMQPPELAAAFGAAARIAIATPAKAIRDAWYAQKSRADAEYNTWWNARKERRAKLGLKPDWDD